MQFLLLRRKCGRRLFLWPARERLCFTRAVEDCGRGALGTGTLTWAPTVGSAGHASSIALGIALQKPDKTIWCIDGDGAALMHMGAIAVIGKAAPENLIHVIINNAAHETVGGMPVCDRKMNWTELARAAGYAQVTTADSPETLEARLTACGAARGPVMLEVRCACGARSDLGRPTTTPVENRDALMAFLRK